VTWLSILKSLLIVSGVLLGWLKQRQLLDAESAETAAADLKAALDEIGRANEIRDRVRRNAARDPASLRGDDGFRRPD
jgi:hypothetical protein